MGWVRPNSKLPNNTKAESLKQALNNVLLSGGHMFFISNSYLNGILKRFVLCIGDASIVT